MEFLLSQELPVSINQQVSLEAIRYSSKQHSMGREMSLDILGKKIPFPDERLAPGIRKQAEYQIKIMSSTKQVGLSDCSWTTSCCCASRVNLGS